MTTNHTPTPWHVASDGLTIKECCDSDRAFPFTVAKVDDVSRTDRANASHIVRCVNSHDALVAALENLVETHDLGEAMHAEFWDIARAALAAAKE